ncbi:MAG TPA: orotidine-5'-phosphate decarboxylase [Methanomassiliicoccales archaeon]|nr:orotidine-5'-phosphate decarboxylase [Methanomassiliicoccales archaeon]
MRIETRLILALDETDEAKALSVAREVSDMVDAIKINWPLVLSTSPRTITALSELAPVICDFKIADIPNTNRLIVEQAVRLGASGVIVQGFVGSDSVKAAVDAANGRDVFVVTEMSHPGGLEFTAPNAEKLAELAVRSGATGVIAPATRPERIRRVREIIGDLLILSPGVGAQGGKASDALRMGADHVIVGRSIYGSDRPRKAAEEVLQEIRTCIFHK